MKDIIKKFDEFLYQKQLFFEGIIIGGAALILIHVEVFGRLKKELGNE